MKKIYSQIKYPLKNILTEFKKEGIIIKEFNDHSIVDDIISKVKSYFNDSTDFYLSMNREEFHEFVIGCQDEINKIQIQKRFFHSEKNVLNGIASDKELLHESIVFLRVVRPISDNGDFEHPDYHRETFYSDHSHTPYVLNTWFPIMNVNDQNTLRYIPRSHVIPDKKIKIRIDSNYSSAVEKFSAGHKMGFFWRPKRIVSGVDLLTAKKIQFKPYTYAIFSSMLIHGGAVNTSDKIRFALGFGLVPKEKVIDNKLFFASGYKKHFVEFD